MSNDLPFTEDELVHRQVHPQFIVAGRVTSQAFLPTKKDGGRLSVSRGALATPEAAFKSYTAGGFASAGVWSVTVAECRSAELGVVADPIEAPMDPAHAFIDFRDLNKNDARSRAQQLAQLAGERGCQYAANK